MKKMSTGENSTLGNWKRLVQVVFGQGPALEFLNNKIKASSNGEDEEVIADESQLLFALGQMQFKKEDSKGGNIKRG